MRDLSSQLVQYFVDPSNQNGDSKTHPFSCILKPAGAGHFFALELMSNRTPGDEALR